MTPRSAAGLGLSAAIDLAGVCLALGWVTGGSRTGATAAAVVGEEPAGADSVTPKGADAVTSGRDAAAGVAAGLATIRGCAACSSAHHHKPPNASNTSAAAPPRNRVRRLGRPARLADGAPMRRAAALARTSAMVGAAAAARAGATDGATDGAAGGAGGTCGLAWTGGSTGTRTSGAAAANGAGTAAPGTAAPGSECVVVRPVLAAAPWLKGSALEKGPILRAALRAAWAPERPARQRGPAAFRRHRKRAWRSRLLQANPVATTCRPDGADACRPLPFSGPPATGSRPPRRHRRPRG
jgi:hypothetical protein